MKDDTPQEEMPVRSDEPLCTPVANMERVSHHSTGPASTDADADPAERAWEGIFNTANDGIWLTDRNFRITRANRASAQILGKPLDEIVGSTCSQAICGTNRPPEDCPCAQAHRTKSHARGEVYVRERDVWLEVAADPVLDDKGEVTGVLHVATDVTNRKKMKEAMCESEERYKDLFENAREAILLTDLDGRITGVNRLVEDYGFRRDELIGRGLLDFVAENDRARALADFQVLLGGAPAAGAMEVITPKGVFCVEYRDNPILRGGRVVGVQAILTDVTEHKRTEQLLRAEKDRVREYLDIAGVILMILDPQGRVKLINRKGCEILGCREEEVVGKTWIDHFVPPSLRDEIRAVFRRIMRGEIDSFERVSNPVVTCTGQQRLIAWHNTVLRDDTGEIVALLSSGEDITDCRQAEEAYRSLVDHSRQGLVIFQDGKAVFANQAMAEIAGYPIDEILALSAEQIRDFVHPEDREFVWQNHRRRLAGEPVPEHYEMRGIRKDGTVRWLDIHASRIDYQGRPAIQAACIDVTRRKQAEESLRLSEKRYRGIFENAVLGMYQTTPEGEILTANPALVRMLGYETFEELAARNLEEERFELEYPRSRFKEQMETEGRIVGLESAWKRRDGSTLWVRESVRIVRDETGRTLFYEGTVEDITEHKQTDRLMQTLAMTAVELVELPPEADLFQFIAEKVLALIGAGIVSVNSIEGDTLTVRQITGAKTVTLKLAQRLLGKAVIGMPVKGLHEEARNHLLTGKLTKIEGGFYELFFHTVPRPVCWTLEKAVGLQECHSIGLRRPDRLLGSVTILSQKATELNAGIIEAFVNQASIALERRKAVEALLQAEERFRTLYESVQAGVILQRADGTIVHANKMACDIFGMTAESIESKTSMDSAWQMILEDGTPVQGEDHPSMITLRTGEPIRGAVRGLFSDDPSQLRWVVINTELLRHRGNDAIEGVLITFHDITALKKAEREVERSDRFLRTVLDSFPGNVAIIDEQAALVTTNRAWVAFGRANGLAPAFLEKGVDYLQVCRSARGEWSEGAQDVAEALNAILAGQRRSFEMEYPCHSPDRKRWFHLQAQGFAFEDKQWAILAHIDITERKQAEEALQESEVRFRTILSAMVDLVFVFDREGRFTFGQGPSQDALLVPAGELLRQYHAEVMPPEIHEKFAKAFARNRAGEADEYDYTLEVNGKTKWFSAKLSPILVEGKFQGAIAVIRDITERKRTETALRESEEKYRELFENAREAIVILNLDKTITDVNKFVELYGFRKEDLIGRNYIEFVAEPYRQKALEDFALLREGMPLEGEFDVLTPKGQIVVYYKDSPIVRDGTVIGVQAILLDVTQHRRAEEALRKSEARYRLLANHASDIIWTADLNLRLTYCSPYLERMLGYRPEEVLSRPADEDLTPASRELVQKTLAEEMEIERSGQGDPRRSRVVEVEEIRKDGTTLWAEIRAGFLRDAKGEAIGIVGVTRDISDRKKVEQQLLDHQDKLRELGTKLTLAEEKERRRIAVGVHDQIGQRLALAKLALQSLQASTIETYTSQTLEGVCKDIDKVLEDTHSLTFELSNPILYEVGFGPAVESWLLEQVQDRHGIACTFEADEPPVELDKETRVVLFDIVRELLTNVIKHAKAKQVDVRIRRINGTVQTSVQDDGIGFQPARSGACVSESGGFGLFNIREKLDYLGGSITIESAPGEGTCIVAVVPLTYPRNSGR